MIKPHTTQRQQLYQVWHGMMQRCYNAERSNYKYYGGVGIAVTPEWHSFARFYHDMFPRPPSLTLERKDRTKGYSKHNCIWATRQQQQANRNGNHFIHFNGTTVTLTEYCKRNNLSYKALANRIYMGWPMQRVLTQPVRQSPKRTRYGQTP